MKNFSLRHNSECTIISTSSATSQVLKPGQPPFMAKVIGRFTIDFTALPGPADVPVSERTRDGNDERYSFFLMKDRHADTRFYSLEEQEKYSQCVFSIFSWPGEIDPDENEAYGGFAEIGFFSPKTREAILGKLATDWWLNSRNSPEVFELREELISNAINSMLPDLIWNAEYEDKYPELAKQKFVAPAKKKTPRINYRQRKIANAIAAVMTMPLGLR